MIKRIIGKAGKYLEIEKRKASTKKILKALEGHQDADFEKIAKTLRFVTTNATWSKEEREALHKIKTLENNYASSQESVAIMDYGAGSSDSNRTDEEMRAGEEVTYTVSKIYRSAASKEKWGKLIFKLVRDFKPQNCLELGTSLGMSSAYQISALKLNNGGKLTSIEGSQEIAAIANKNLRDFNYPNFTVEVGRFSDVLPKLLDKNKPFDFVFIDGHHDKDATRDYFEQLYPFLNQKSLVIFDDINWSKGMNEVWQEIFTDKRIKASFDLYNWGICLIEKGAGQKDDNYLKLGF